MKKSLIIILLIVYLTCIITIIYSYSDKNYILFGTNTIVTYKNGEISKIKKTKNINRRIDYEKMYVYNDQFDEYYVNMYDEDGLPFYDIYNKNYELIYLDKPLLAYKGNININVAKSNIVYDMDNNDIAIIEKALKNKGINSEILDSSKGIIDIDNDGEKETIYSVNNYGSINDKEIYFYNFIKESDNNIIDIDLTFENDKNSLTIPRKYLKWIIDLDSDNNYEIILSNTIGDDSIVYYDFYKYDNNSKKVNILN